MALLTLVILWSGGPTSANAALFSLDDPVFGLGSITLDTETGLQWLDVTASVNRTYADVAAQFGTSGDFAGFRHATAVELNALLLSPLTRHGVVPVQDLLSRTNTTAIEVPDGFPMEIGGIFGPTGTTVGYFDDEDATDMRVGAARLVHAISSLVATEPQQFPGLAAEYESDVVVTPNHALDAALPDVGHWLVRSVAIPDLGREAVETTIHIDPRLHSPNDLGIAPGVTHGWTFTVRAPTKVTGIGWLDFGQDGLVSDHAVGIWGPNGPVVLSTIPGDDEATLVGPWRAVDLPDFVLSEGEYVIGGTTPGGDEVVYAAYSPRPVTHPNLEIGLPTFDGVGTFRVGGPAHLVNGAYLGPTFFAEPDSSPPIIDSPPTVIGHNESIGSNTQLNVYDGGEVGDSFAAGRGVSENVEVNVFGGRIGQNFQAFDGSKVHIRGGIVGHEFAAFQGSRVRVSGGQVGHLFARPGSEIVVTGGDIQDIALDGSDVTFGGGAIGSLSYFSSFQSSAIKAFGTDLSLNRQPLSELKVGEPHLITDRPRALSGMFADGTRFNFQISDPGTELVVTLISLLPGDYNSNGLVDQADLDLVLLNWGKDLFNPFEAGWINDLPRDAIDQEELDTVLLNWGNSIEGLGVVGVPEPPAWLLAALVVLAGLVGVLRNASRIREVSTCHAGAMNILFGVVSQGEVANVPILRTDTEFDGTIWELSGTFGKGVATSAMGHVFATVAMTSPTQVAANGTIITYTLDNSELPTGNYELSPNFLINCVGTNSDANINGQLTGLSFVSGSLVIEPAAANALLFYNNSAFDGNRSLVDESDFAAIAPDKQALRFDHSATEANISGYSRGINGLFVDIDELPADGANIDAEDFILTTGDNDFPMTWSPADASAVGVLPRLGEDGSDRVYLTFPDGSINNTWLRVTVTANGDTGLVADEDLFSGAAGGETGAGFLPRVVGVDAADRQSIAGDLTPLAEAGTVPVVNPNDVNRDGTVNAFDLQSVAVNLSTSAIHLITPQYAVAFDTVVVPEPSSCVNLKILLCLAVTAAARRRLIPLQFATPL